MPTQPLKRPVQLTRLIAVNWYGFNQVIDVQGNLLITGEYGTGKSALLDLIQRVLLGSKARFNRAATGDASKRDLRGYCLCDTNTSTEAAEQFSRDQAVTFAGLEFTWPDGKRRQTWGQRIEFESPTSRPSILFFCYPDRLDLSAACNEAGEFVGEAQFRAWLKREGADYWDREESYLENLATPGNLNLNLKLLVRTLPEALAFQRIASFDRFIRERLLAEAPLEVDEVRRSLEVHRDYSRKLEKYEKQLADLKVISEHHRLQMDSDREARLMRIVEKQMALNRASDQRERAEALLVSLRSQAEDEQRQLTEVRVRLAAVRQALQSTGGDPDAMRLATLRARETTLNQEVRNLTQQRLDTLNQLHEHGEAWHRWLQVGRQLPTDRLRDKLEPRPDLLTALHSSEAQTGLAALPALAAHFNQLRVSAAGIQAEFGGQVRALTAEVNALKRDVDRLDRGQTPGQFPLLEHLQQKLPVVPGSFGPEQLCRLVEVKPEEERWRPALELFLRNNRFAIILDPERHRLAQKMVQQFDRETRREPLIDPEEAAKLEARVLPNSLAEKITTVNATAREFLNHLLGNLIGVESTDQFAGKSRAITDDATLWNRPVTVKLGKTTELEPVIGVRGLEAMRKRKNVLLATKSVELSQVRDVSERFTRWLESGEELQLGSLNLPGADSLLERLGTFKSELAGIQAELRVLMRPDLEERVRELQQLKEQEVQCIQQEALLSRGATARAILEQEERTAKAQSMENEARVGREEAMIRHGAGLSRETIAESVRQVESLDPAWDHRIEQAQERRASAEKRAESERQQKFHYRQLLRLAHSEFARFEHLEQHDDNAEYDAELRILEDQKVGEYRRKSDETRREWEDRLKQHVLGELKKRTDAVVAEMNQLNATIPHPIGRNRYRLSRQQRKDGDFDLLWKLLRTGLEPSDPLMAAIRDPEVDQARQLLMAAVEAKDPADPIRQRLDYREYFKFDMECKDTGLPEDSGWVPLTRHAGKLSGGENQSPFFLAMLAAFLRVFHRAEPGSISRRDTIGLVAMDEAFSKLSGEGVENCMQTSKALGLQLVLAMPDKDATAALRAADTVLFVTIEKRSDPDGRLVIENWAHPARASETLAELEG